MLFPLTLAIAASAVAAADYWKPAVGASWQIVLQDAIDSSGDIVPKVDVWDIDLADNDVSTIKKLQQKYNSKVVCYFSAGSWEGWRDDRDDIPEKDRGEDLDDWDQERWIDTRSEDVRKLMLRRIQTAKDKGCDAIDPDNVDGYSHNSGKNLTEETAIDYITFLAKAAHDKGMSFGLKNADQIIPKVLDLVDFSVNEQCVQCGECQKFAPFIKAGKPVFHIEYPENKKTCNRQVNQATICSKKGLAAGSDGFSTLMKPADEIVGNVRYCDGTEYETKTVQ